MQVKTIAICLAGLAIPLLALPLEDTSSTQAKRQIGTWPHECDYDEIVTDGKNGGIKGKAHHHAQVSEPTQCNNGPCSVSKLTQRTFGIELGGGISGGAAVLSLGASAAVTEEWTSGEEHSCSAGKGETVCVFVSTAYTYYDVTWQQQDMCTNDNRYIRAKFPNADNVGGGYYCVRGKEHCQDNGGEGYWREGKQKPLPEGGVMGD